MEVVRLIKMKSTIFETVQVSNFPIPTHQYG